MRPLKFVAPGTVHRLSSTVYTVASWRRARSRRRAAVTTVPPCLLFGTGLRAGWRERGGRGRVGRFSVLGAETAALGATSR